MGAWSNKPFGNDSALDWLERAALPSTNQFSAFVSDTISTVLGNWAGDSDEAEQAIAAIAVVSAAAVEPIGPCHKDAKALISQFGFVPDTRLITNCLSALQVVCYSEASELRELWNDEGSVVSWIKQTERLSIALNAALKNGLPTRVPKKQGMPRALNKLVALYEKEPTVKVRKKITEKFSALNDFTANTEETGFKTPLWFAARHGLLEETEDLLNRGADPNGGGEGRFFRALYEVDSPFKGNFPAACLSGNLQVAELLRVRGAKVFLQRSVDTDLIETYKRLRIDFTQLNGQYCPALQLVASDGTPAAVEYLLGLGANIDEIDDEGKGIAHWAAGEGNIQMLEFLKEKGRDLDLAAGQFGPTPLHTAVHGGQFKAVSFLLENGANPNHIDQSQLLWPCTTLKFAIWREDKKMMALLKEYGATD
jgi:ankyrin repeat protein